MPEALLALEGLSVLVPPLRGAGPDRTPVLPVRGVSLDVARGEVLGVVGESGSGKTLTFLAALGLLPAGMRSEGRALFAGRDLLELDEFALQSVRGAGVAMVFQDAMSSLTPHLQVGTQLAEMAVTHANTSWAQARAQALRMLDRVGVPEAARRASQYPHELSGGLRQRVMIGMSLMCAPALLIADEPTTALDVTVQAQIIELLASLRASEGMALVLISHDLAVVGALADRIAVLYAGRVVERGPAEAVMRRPRHPYTHGLIECTPDVRAPLRERMPTLPGQPPRVGSSPAGCAFAPRCPRAAERCRVERPLLGSGGDEARDAPADLATPRQAAGGRGHEAACHFPLSP